MASITNGVLTPLAALPLNPDEGFVRILVAKKSGVVAGKEIARESMAVDVPASALTLNDDDIAKLRPWINVAFAGAVEKSLCNILRDINTCGELSVEHRTGIGEAYGTKSMLIQILLDSLNAQRAQTVRVTKELVAGIFADEGIRGAYLAVVASKQGWDIQAITPVQAGKFTAYYNGTVVPTVQVLASNMAGTVAIDKALAALAIMPDSENKEILLARAAMLREKAVARESGLSDDEDLGLF